MKRIAFILTILCTIGVSVQAQKYEIKYDDNFKKQGVVDPNGKLIIPIEYHWCEIPYDLSKEPLIRVHDFDNTVAAFSLEGKQLTPFHQYEGIDYTPYGFIGRNYKTNPTSIWMGFLSLEGKEILPCEFSYILPKENFIEVQKRTPSKTLHGLYTHQGKELIPCNYGHLIYYKHCILVSISGSLLDQGTEGIYSMQGELIVPCKYNILRASSEDCSYEMFEIRQGKENKSFVVFNENGELAVPFNMYQGIEHADNSNRLLYTILKDGKWGLWYQDKEIMACQYDAPIKFSNDVATVKKDGEAKLIKNPLKDASQILIAESKTDTKKKVKGPAVSRYPKPDSDVDSNIPVAKKQAENTFAFIICNENYPDAPVPYSLNDGRMFLEYCKKTLGIPEKNINLYEDATYGNIITAVEKMKSVADSYDGEASIIFYYAGHGFPDEKQSTAYLLPIDGNASDITTTGYSLAKFYKELAAMKLKSSVVFLDACFSGAKREDEMLASSRGVAIKVKDEAPQGNMIVFSAAQGDETAHQLEEKHHGLFTYYLLKELQATEGDVDMGTLTEYVTKQVKRQSVVINNKKQTPKVNASTALAGSWQNLKLK